ncbi:DNA-3-methyladenine glycosylase family protein [Mucilaginibacter myungsuensis]|uniref:DNA-3-methyladenine glycosylase II n=1 Tax=Mucilaginibacter myungsuensis TaxID=649104 RepID=A0A929PVL4_9SPHI|nr:DNA-3-methyladenine glycosylase 2 family protein [Mucilaginibacter myungsuensis]MBE9661146.1 DNA-3-methyladenine glycosylase 2 family protein [Mucilaginibacter myungsuensis]MDN3597291.1 DNA-3-methyladenine glycosylase 2 family protein [Mucilaginibacter myungsuensis]
MLNQVTISTFHTICHQLAERDLHLASVIRRYGYPPMWSRPNTFESLVHIILEQQVSLASALSVLNKLRERLTKITPKGVLELSDEELKACYFSRQKTAYVRYLAEAIINVNIDLKAFETMADDDVRAKLVSLKGIGNWTVDVYLMFVLQRADIFPAGDLAAVNAFKRLKGLPAAITREELIALAEQWRPNRSVATMILWHYYLSTPRK